MLPGKILHWEFPWPIGLWSGILSLPLGVEGPGHKSWAILLGMGRATGLGSSIPSQYSTNLDLQCLDSQGPQFMQLESGNNSRS